MQWKSSSYSVLASIICPFQLSAVALEWCLKWDICSCSGQSSITSDFVECVSQQMVTLQCGLQRLKVGWSNEVIYRLQKKKHQTLHEGMETWLTSITLFLEKISACAKSRYKAFDYAYFIWTMPIIGAGRGGGGACAPPWRDFATYCPSLVPRPHPLTRRNGLVNQVKFLGLAHTFVTM